MSIRGFALLCAFAVFVAMVVLGQRTVGWQYLGVQLLGLLGLVLLLGLYNRRYR
jgi:drug/metabolite transporter (DMT)-like permease